MNPAVQRKKILLIGFHFPPDDSVGGLRLARFAKYLPEFGWNPIVLTVKENFYDRLDYSHLDKAISDLAVSRCNLIRGPLQMFSNFRNGKKSYITLDPCRRLGLMANNVRKSAFKQLVSSIVRIPDDKQGWIISVVLHGLALLRKEKARIFVTSGPPMSTHVGGLLMKWMSGAKWVADFRDPWTGNSWKSSSYRTKLSDTVEKWLEERVAVAADRIVCTAPSLTEYFRSNVKGGGQEKCLTITNGYEEEEFEGLGQSNSVKKSQITVSYSGSLYLNRNPEPFLRVLSRLAQVGVLGERDFEADLIGDCYSYGDISVQDLIDKYGLSGLVKLPGRIPRRDCLERLSRSDGLVLFAQGQPQQIPAKVFEYIRINKPILGFMEEGDTKNILSNFENSFIADPSDMEDIERKTLAFLGRIRGAQTRLGSDDEINKYNWETQVRKLAKCLAELV